jgi:very-short-patch-repair endonuclease
VWQRVYAVGIVPSEPRARAHGALLAVGADAALGATSAAAAYGAQARWEEPFELISTHRCRVSGLRTHTSLTLASWDRRRLGRLWVTSPARTALDLAPRVDARRLKAMVDHLRLQNGLTLDQLADIVARNPRHPGARALARVSGQMSSRPARSDLERRRWPAFARAHHLPAYETNVMVAGYEADVLVAGVVVVELDTVATHLLNFHTDRRRDADILARTGIPTIRVTDEQLEEDPARVAAQILAVVRSRRGSKP